MTAPQPTPETTQDDLPPLLPTVPGKVSGIVSLDPPTVQCHQCRATHTEPQLGLCVILSGYRFHTCEKNPVRLCRDCMAPVHAACPSTHE